MYIVAHDSFGQVVKMPITSVVVYDDADNPIVVSVKLMNKVATVAHALDKDFAEVLKNLGVDRTVVVDFLDSSYPPQKAL